MLRRPGAIVFVAMCVVNFATAGDTSGDAPADARGDIPRNTLVFELSSARDLVGTESYVRASYEDTLADIGYRHALGYRELRLANPDVDPWLPGEGRMINLPTRFVLPMAERRGIVLNTAEMRLYYYPENERGKVFTFPVSIGRGEWQTPLGSTTIVDKTLNPAWYPPSSIREEYAESGDELPQVIPPGPDNPLGRYALYLALPGYLIHGTNRPYGIGMPVTHGCIRLHPDDIELLFERVDENTPVKLLHQPLKAGWHDGVLYLEAHPSRDGTPTDRTTLVRAIMQATASAQDYWINWERAREIAERADGTPRPIGREVPVERRLTLR